MPRYRQQFAGCLHLFENIGALHFESFPVAGNSRIEGLPVGQDEPHGPRCMISIVRDTATHTAGVVGKDPAHHGRADAGRVRPDLPAIWLQPRIHHSTRDAGTDSDEPAAIGEP